MINLEDYLQKEYPDTTTIISVEDGLITGVTKNDGTLDDIDYIVIDYDDLDSNCCPMCGGTFIDEFICPDCGIDWR